MLNNRWKDSHTWAQRVIAYSKSNKTLEAKRLYCRLAILSHKDLEYYDFEPEFDLAAIVRYILAFKADDFIDDYEPLIYDEAMAGPYAKQWKEAINKKILFFVKLGIYKLVLRSKDTPVFLGR